MFICGMLWCFFLFNIYYNCCGIISPLKDYKQTNSISAHRTVDANVGTIGTLTIREKLTDK